MNSSIKLLLCGMLFITNNILASDLNKAIKDAMRTNDSIEYRYALIDLDNDKILDAVVLLNSPDYCGSGGCRMLILKGAGDTFAAVSSFFIAKEPIYLLEEMNSGSQSVAVTVSGGGMKRQQELIRFDGEKYRSIPSMSHKVSGKELAAGKQIPLAFYHASWTKILMTANYEIRIESMCEKTRNDCSSITYTGKNKKNGQTIQLWGAMWHTASLDEPAKVNANYYRFKNGNVAYLVSYAGSLKVVRNENEVIFEENGHWLE